MALDSSQPCCVLLAILLATTVCEVSGQFLEHPSTQTAVPGAVTQFTCVFNYASDYHFELNGRNDVAEGREKLSYNSICNSTACIISIYLTADNIENPNGTTVQCFAYFAGYLPSEMAYLYIAGPPLAPYPRLSSSNATSLIITWEKPYTWDQVADIYSYTIRMFNSSNNETRTWIANVSAGITWYCADIDTWSVYVHPCPNSVIDDDGTLNLTYYNFLGTRKTHTQKCDTLVWYVSATSAAGKSDSAAIRGGFSPECLPFELEKQPWDIQQPIVAEAYYNNVGNGTMAVLINMKLPEICYFTMAKYFIFLQNTAKDFMETIVLDSNAGNIQYLLDIPLPNKTAQITYEVTIYLSHPGWNTYYAANFSVQPYQALVTGHENSNTSSGSIPLDHNLCNVQYALLSFMSVTISVLLITVWINVALFYQYIRQNSSERTLMRLQQINPIYTDNEHHLYEPVDKYKQLVLNVNVNTTEFSVTTQLEHF